MNSEEAYFEKIDCKLNYSSFENLEFLFNEAKSISTICVFRFLEELAYIPNRRINRTKYLKIYENILNHADVNFMHSLKPLVLSAIVSKMNRSPLPVKRALIYLEKIKEFRNYYSALNIILVCTRGNAKSYLAEKKHGKIIEDWR